MPTLALIPSVDSLNESGGSGNGLYGRAKWLARGGSKPTATALTPWYRVDQDGVQHSTLSEAFRSLRTSVLLSSSEYPPRSLLVTSAQQGEGKSTVATNLAISLAQQMEYRVLLIDGDMRHPCIHKVFAIKDSPGLVGYLTGEQNWQALVQSTGLTGLDALVCGPVLPNPPDLLSSERMGTLIHKAMGE